jgi:hypothetical protein
MDEFDLDLNDYLTPSEAQDKFNVHPRTLKRWEEKGLLGDVKRTPGGHRRYTSDQIENAIKRKQVGDVDEEDDESLDIDLEDEASGEDDIPF